MFIVARIAARRERGLGVISALMLLVQGGLHVWLNAAQHTGTSAGFAHGCAAMAPMPGMNAAAMCPGASGLHSAGGMMLAHALAALGAAWWLRRGEAALFRLARVLLLVVATAAVAVRMLFPPSRARWRGPRIPGAADQARRPTRLMLLRYAVARRGPPRMGMAV